MRNKGACSRDSGHHDQKHGQRHSTPGTHQRAGVGRVEQYIRKGRSALEPEDQDALRRAGNGFAADREACQEAGGVGKWLKSSS